VPDKITPIAQAYPRHQEYDPAREATAAGRSPDCELGEGLLSVMYITVSVGSNYIMCMFWEGEKRRARGPTDNIHKMPS
jgi:hypothetical protein